MSLRRTALARKSELRRSTPMPRRTRETKARATKTVALFTDTGLRLPSLTERRELNNSPELKAAQAAIRESFTPAQASRLRWAGQ